VGQNINIINNYTQTLLDINMEVDLESNADKTKYMFMNRHQNAVQNHNLVIANKSFTMWES